MTHDCIVVGAGAAGLSAALVLGRARRTTLVLDAGGQSNLPAHAIGGLLGQDGTAPAELYADGAAQLAALPTVRRQAATVAQVAPTSGPDGARFAVTLADGGSERTRLLLLATGTEYTPPSLPGLDELWGDTVFHCPFCHGWEVRDRPLAVLRSGSHGPFQALLLRNWSDEVTLLTDGPAREAPADLARLQAAGVTIDERPVRALRAAAPAGGGGPVLAAIVFADGSELARDGLLVETGMRPRTALAEALGLSLGPQGAIAVDDFGRASLDGVFAAGDAGGERQVATAIGSGSTAGSFAVTQLVCEERGLPFPPGAPARG
jgi:thioredoxin reductase